MIICLTVITLCVKAEANQCKNTPPPTPRPQGKAIMLAFHLSQPYSVFDVSVKKKISAWILCHTTYIEAGASALKLLDMCFSEQRNKSLDPLLLTRHFLQSLYISSPIKCMFYGNYALCVAREGTG